MFDFYKATASKRAVSSGVLCAAILACTALAGTPALKLGDVSLGNNLETFSTVVLSEPAPPGDLKLTLVSQDPGRLLLSKTPEAVGEASIVITVKSRFRESPEFWLHALSDEGEASYTVSAPGYEPATGTVRFSPSGVVFWGPYGKTAPGFSTTPRGWPSKLTLHAVRLDSSLNVIEPQYVRGGFALEFRLACSDPSVGRVEPEVIRIPAATEAGTALFQPKSAGTTTIAAGSVPFLRTPATLSSLTATVRAPGIGVADELTVGEHLQTGGALSLGEPAPPGGVTVTLKSEDGSKLLLSAKSTEEGKPTLAIHMPEGAVNTTYYLQSLSRTGSVKHTAVAPGYTSRTGVIALAPSGVIISTKHHGPPDEAELFRPEAAGGPRNSVITRLNEPVEVTLMTAFLDPKSRRAADITVQPLRGGLALEVEVANSEPGVGTLPSRFTLRAGVDRSVMTFLPKTPGKAVLTVDTPKDFVRPTNSVELVVTVKE